MIVSALRSMAAKLLPQWIYFRLVSRWNEHGFRRYFANTGWIFIAKIFSFAISLLTVAIVARYLGPENYGKLSYAQSFVAIFSIFATLGMDQIIYRNLVAEPDKESEWLGTAIAIKLFFGALTLITTVAAATIINSDPTLTLLIGIVAITFILQPFSTTSILFNALVKAKYVTYVTLAVTILVPLLKLATIYFGGGIIYFASIIVTEALCYGVAYIFIYHNHFNRSLLAWKFSKTRCKQLLYESAPMVIAGITGYLYARIDQILILQYIDAATVGLYDVAVRLTEYLGFIPGIIIVSLFPAIINARQSNAQEYRHRLRLLAAVCIALSIVSASVIYLLAPFIIDFLFGKNFSGSTDLLQIYVWSTIGTTAFILIQNFLIAESQSLYIFWLSLLGAIINIALNVMLIPLYGAEGAAIATLITLIAIILTFLIFLRHYRPKTVCTT